MAYLMLKRGKWMEGHGYATFFGYTFSWTHDQARARRFADHVSLDLFMHLTGAKPVHVPNNRAELREIGRQRMELRRAAHRVPNVHDKINRRAARRP